MYVFTCSQFCSATVLGFSVVMGSNLVGLVCNNDLKFPIQKFCPVCIDFGVDCLQ